MIFDRTKRSKKGSLSLSVNAIVILVLAIVMLGLGLGFTKGMFAKLKGKLEIPPPDIPATADEAIVLPSDEVALRRGEGTININIFNPCSSATGSPPMVSAVFTASCLAADGSVLSPAWTDISSVPQRVRTDEYRTFKIVAGGTTPLPGGTSCLVTITAAADTGAATPCNIASKQITLTSK